MLRMLLILCWLVLSFLLACGGTTGTGSHRGGVDLAPSASPSSTTAGASSTAQATQPGTTTAAPTALPSSPTSVPYATRTAPHWRQPVEHSPKLDTAVDQVIRAYEQGELAQAAQYLNFKREGELLEVQIYVRGEAQAAERVIAAHGGVRLHSGEIMVNAWVPAGKLRALADHPAIGRIANVSPPNPAARRDPGSKHAGSWRQPFNPGPVLSTTVARLVRA